MKKKILSILAAITLVAGTVPSAFATDYTFGNVKVSVPERTNVNRYGTDYRITLTFENDIDPLTATTDNLGLKFILKENTTAPERIQVLQEGDIEVVDSKTVKLDIRGLFMDQSAMISFGKGLSYADGTSVFGKYTEYGNNRLQAMSWSAAIPYRKNQKIIKLASTYYLADEDNSNLTDNTTLDYLGNGNWVGSSNPDANYDKKIDKYTDENKSYVIMDLGQERNVSGVLMYIGGTKNTDQSSRAVGSEIYGTNNPDAGFGDVDGDGTISENESKLLHKITENDARYRQAVQVGFDNDEMYRYLLIRNTENDILANEINFHAREIYPTFTVENTSDTSEGKVKNGIKESLPLKLVFDENTDMSTVKPENITITTGDGQNYAYSFMETDSEEPYVRYIDKCVLPLDGNITITLTNGVKSITKNSPQSDSNNVTFKTQRIEPAKYNADKYFKALDGRTASVVTVNESGTSAELRPKLVQGWNQGAGNIATFDETSGEGQYVMVDLGSEYDIASVGIGHATRTDNNEIQGTKIYGSTDLVTNPTNATFLGTVDFTGSGYTTMKGISLTDGAKYRYIYAYMTPEQAEINGKDKFELAYISVSAYFDRNANENQFYFLYDGTNLKATVSDVAFRDKLIVIAKYDKSMEELIDIVSEVPSSANGWLNSIPYDKDYEYKAFLWDTFEGMKPIANAIQY